MWNEIKLIRTENTRLKAENLGLKETCDLFEVKLSEKMEEIEALQLELNVNLNQRQIQFGATKVCSFNYLKNLIFFFFFLSIFTIKS